MNAPDKIKKLTEIFDYNLETYKKGSYNETQVRREFIDPFFEALGWDIANKKGYAEAYKDVIHEDAQGLNPKAAANLNRIIRRC